MICITILPPAHLHVGAIQLTLVPGPQVLLIVVQAVVDGLGELGSDFGAGDVVACTVASRVLAQVRWRLCDDQDLVHVAVIQLTVRIVIRPISKGVLARCCELFHLFIKQEVQLFLVSLEWWICLDWC